MATPVRLGLIGAGRWGRVYIKTLEALKARALGITDFLELLANWGECP